MKKSAFQTKIDPTGSETGSARGGIDFVLKLHLKILKVCYYINTNQRQVYDLLVLILLD